MFFLLSKSATCNLAFCVAFGVIASSLHCGLSVHVGTEQHFVNINYSGITKWLKKSFVFVYNACKYLTSTVCEIYLVLPLYWEGGCKMYHLLLQN